jgi:hypothetical protein
VSAPTTATKYTPYGTMKLALRYGAILTAAMLVVGGVVGYLVAGVPGLLGALIGAGVTAILMGLTAASFLLAVRVTKGDPLHPGFYGIVLGSSAVKLVVFLVIMITLRGVPFIDPRVMFVAVIVAVAGSLVVDVLAFARARVPYVSNVELPGGQ